MSRITKTFNNLRKKGRKAFIPYVMAGDPSLEETARLVKLLEECGADIIELGVPFSDPLADGPVIQRAAERALAQGVGLRDVISLVGKLRVSTQIPLVLMTYYNPVFKMGEEAFMRSASEAGVDGVIVPDLPPDEAKSFMMYAKSYGIDTIFLLAPTSNETRRKIVSRAARGFIYYVSLTGITGSRITLGKELRDSIAEIRKMSKKPVALGFGVSNPEEAASVSAIADGVIVGSAIVNRIADKGLREFLTNLRNAIR